MALLWVVLVTLCIVGLWRWFGNESVSSLPSYETLRFESEQVGWETEEKDLGMDGGDPLFPLTFSQGSRRVELRQETSSVYTMRFRLETHDKHLSEYSFWSHESVLLSKEWERVFGPLRRMIQERDDDFVSVADGRFVFVGDLFGAHLVFGHLATGCLPWSDRYLQGLPLSSLQSEFQESGAEKQRAWKHLNIMDFVGLHEGVLYVQHSTSSPEQDLGSFLLFCQRFSAHLTRWGKGEKAHLHNVLAQMKEDAGWLEQAGHLTDACRQVLHDFECEVLGSIDD